jgi:tRNA modification GTPase
LPSQPLERIVLGHWQSPGGEELIVCRRASQRIEIHCHGGQAASAAIIEALLEHGCVQISWQQWLREHEEDKIAAEALVALAAARTERTALILLDQYKGALRQAVDDLDRLVASFDRAAALDRAGRLLALAPLGRHLVEPWRVVLAGRPNVGKSSLINALVGYDRAIVYDAPGTTRDVVTASAAFDGWPVELSDTAGLRVSNDRLEAAGVELAVDRLCAADLVLLVFDASCPWSPNDAELAAAWPEALVVQNKCDLPEVAGKSRPGGLRTSTVTGRGLPELEREIADRLVRRPPAPGEAVPFTDVQCQDLLQVQDALEHGDFPAARELLCSGPFFRSRLV